jgi:hypothetical protein
MIIVICVLAFLPFCSAIAMAYVNVYLYKENVKLNEALMRVQNPVAVNAIKASEPVELPDKPQPPQPIYR